MWMFEDYRESGHCRQCGQAIDQAGLCVLCGRKLYNPCGTTREAVKAGPDEELERLRSWIEEEQRRRWFAVRFI